MSILPTTGPSTPIPPIHAALYRQIVESGNEGIWVFDPEGRTAYVNERMAAMLGYSVAEMGSISLLDVLDDEGRDQGVDFLARQRQTGGTTESAECLLLRRDGEAVWTVVSHSPWQDRDGTFLGLIAFVSDITERRRLSEALIRREEQLEEAQRVARLGSWEWDVCADVLHWSEEMFDVFMITRDGFDSTYAGYLALLHPEDRATTAESVAACLDGRTAGFECEQRVLDRSGTRVVWVRASGEVVRDGDGRPISMRGTALDITAYKEAELRLHAATTRHRLLQTMAAAANEAQTLDEVALISLREMCTHLDWLAGRALLVSEEDGALVPVGTWQRPASVPPGPSTASVDSLSFRWEAASDLAVAVRETAEARWTCGTDLVEAIAGSPLQAFAVPVRARGEVVAVLEFVADRSVEPSEALAICQEVSTQLAVVAERQRTSSELQRARDTAVAALRARSDFLATMSHEIRTPMNGVIGLAELLLSTDLDERQHRYVEGLQTAGEALLAIINDILDFAKVEGGRVQLELIDLDVTQLIEEVAGLLARQAQAKGLELITRGGLDLPAPLRGDPSRLRQVLLNLASNAIKFTDAGEVVIGARLVGSTDDAVDIEFEVVDTGIGIAPVDQHHIFEPFAQVDASTTRRFGGTGLGLAISRQLVEAMDGDLTVVSGSGVGSAFRFTVRLLRTDQGDHGHVGSRLPRGAPVLVVDDNATCREVLGELLVAWGLEAHLAEDSATARQLLEDAGSRGRPYAVALLDLTMPRAGGTDATEMIMDVAASVGTQLVALTPVGLDPSGLKRVPASAQLHKPVRSAQLYACVLEALQAPDAAASRPARSDDDHGLTRRRDVVGALLPSVDE